MFSLNTLRTIFIPLLTILLTSIPLSAAKSNPQITQCRILGGEFFVAENSSNNIIDQFVLCNFEDSIIGAIDLLRFLDNTDDILSIQTYRNNIQYCEPFGHKVQFKNLEDQSIALCAFSDKSLIGLDTLQFGLTSPANAKLNLALGIQ